MALANFFDKAALAAAQVLRGYDRAALEGALSSHVVGVFFDAGAADASEGCAALDLTVRLAARLYPRVRITCAAADGRVTDLLGDLVRLARQINPDIEIDTTAADTTVCIAVGSTRPPVACPVVYVGSDGWVARLSRDGPVGCGNSSNPFGAGAAACLAAANVFRLLFADQLPGGAPDAALSFSLLDCQPNHARPTNPLLGPVDLGETHLVGFGAIGNGVAWVLARLRDDTGDLHVVDPQLIDLTNLQRYVLLTQSDVHAVKVDAAAAALASSSLRVHPHHQSWGSYLRQRGDWNLERVAVAVDSAVDRCAVQASLPRFLANAWTQTGDLGVSRHRFVDSGACAVCLYLPESVQKSEDEVVADAIGLPGAVREVRALLATGAPVQHDLIARIAAALSVPEEPLLQFAGRPLRAFYAEAICGGVILRLAHDRCGGPNRDRAGYVDVPMAFQSALAGIMLAAELVADAAGLRAEETPSTTRINLLRPLAAYLSVPAAKHRSGRCICQDADYVTAYYAKYGRAGVTATTRSAD